MYQELPKGFLNIASVGVLAPRQFKFYEAGREALGVQGPWLVLVDLRRKAEIRRILPSPDLLDPKFPGFCYGNLPNGHALLAVNPHGDSAAVAFNVAKAPRLFLFDSELRKPVKNLPLLRYVADIGWLPDGERLVVLYSGQFDDKYVFHGTDTGFTTLNLPDVEIFDSHSGKEVMRFFTGAIEAKVAFSNDGKLMYCISQASSIGGGWFGWKPPEGVIRVFSVADGRLVRTITGRRSGIHNNFVISPDGRFIAADAGTPVGGFHIEEPFCVKVGGFVMIDVDSGRVIYEYHKRMRGLYDMPMAFAFSPGGQLLFVDPNHGGCGAGTRIDAWVSGDSKWWKIGKTTHESGEQIDVYSLEGLR